FVSLGIIIFIENKTTSLESINKFFILANRLIAISFISLGLMIFSFIGTQSGYRESFILVFNLVFSLTIFIVGLMPVFVFFI
ncbi:MAG: hypothetical protein AABY14_01875, partial [Nanoarchaeota archaeon]